MDRTLRETSYFGKVIFAAFTLVFAAMLGFASVESAGAVPTARASNVYGLEMTILKDGQLLASPKMTVLFGKPARFTLAKPNGKEGSLRVQIVATPGDKTAKGVSTVNLSAMVLEQIGGAWVVVGEPSIRAADGKAAAMSIDRSMSSIQVTITATSKFSEKALTVVPKQCGAIDAPIVSLGGGGLCPNCPQLPCDGCPDCCTAPCSDGSGSTLTCCGAVECCDGVCGACCSPPL